MAYRDNVEITEESYVPGGFSAEEYIGTPAGVSYAGGFGYNDGGEGVDFGEIKPARKRRSALQNGMMTIADILKISASMPNLYGQAAIEPGSAYLGMTEEEANRRDKIRAEEDLAGKEMDINRAKVLSTRAAATDNEEEKKKYGAAIKKLLPEETQGLDDLTASDFFNSTDNKLKLEQLKGYNKLQQIAAQNQGKLDVAGLNNASREGIAAAKNATQLEIHQMDNAIKQAIADGKNDTALQLMDKKADLQTAIHMLDNSADYEREALKQSSAMERVQAQQNGAMDRVKAQQEGAMARTEANNKRAMAVAMMRPIGGAGGRGGTAKERAASEALQYRIENWGDYVAKQDQDLNTIQQAIQTLKQNPSASGFITNLGMKFGGLGVSPATQRAYGDLNEKTTRLVLQIIEQLNAAGATSSVFNSESEQARIIGLISDPAAPYSARVKAFESFYDRLKNFYDSDRKMTAWKAQKMGQGVSTPQAQGSSVVSASTTNNNRRKVDGGMEW